MSTMILRRNRHKHMILRQVMSQMADGREHGYVVCLTQKGDMYKGPEAVGHRYGVRISPTCRVGKPCAVFHTHPGGVPEPSEADVRAAQEQRIPWMCIGVPETGEIKCHRVPGVPWQPSIP